MQRAAATFPLSGPWGWGAAACVPLVAWAFLQHLPRLPSAPWALCVAVLAAGLATVSARVFWARRVLPAACVLLSLGAAAVAWGSWRAELRMSLALPAAWEGRVLRFEAEVSGLPQPLAGMGDRMLWRLTLVPLGAAQDADGAQLQLPSGLTVLLPQDLGTPSGGEQWAFQARLKRVHAMQNPGVPDAELWLLERGIQAQGSATQARRLAGAPWWSLASARQSLRDRLFSSLHDPRERAVVAGLLLGDQAALSSSDWALLRDTGVVHLFSISGLHITGFAWLAAQLIGLAWRRQPSWCLRWPAPGVARWGGVFMATAYALLAGWGVPAQRTVALLMLVALLQSSGRLWPWPLALLVCAVPIGLADPWAMVQPGFWLSFVAVALLMQQSTQPAGGWRAALKDFLRTQAVCTVGLAPLLVLFFGQISLVGVLANLVAVPVVTWLLTPLCLLGALIPWAWGLAAYTVQALFALLTEMATWPWAVWSLPQAPFGVQALALAGLLLAALRLPRAWRVAAALLAVPLFCLPANRPAPGEFRLRVFDVGQGSATWLQTAGHDMVVDAGPRWGVGAGQDAAARVVLPSLRAAGVQRLDLLMLTHGDADHAGGAASLRRGLPVSLVRAPSDPRLRAFEPAPCHAGLQWEWDGVRFTVVHPWAGESPRNSNASGCVLCVQAANGASVLMAADIEAPEEARSKPAACRPPRCCSCRTMAATPRPPRVS
jgi:competence protein ComEC